MSCLDWVHMEVRPADKTARRREQVAPRTCGHDAHAPALPKTSRRHAGMRVARQASRRDNPKATRLILPRACDRRFTIWYGGFDVQHRS